MVIRLITILGVALAVSLNPAEALVVTTTADSGVGSLRWCIERANSDTDLDLITFDKLLSGSTIVLVGSLPQITQLVTIDGDVNDDGLPDFELDGAAVTTGPGLDIKLPELPMAAAAAPPSLSPAAPVPQGCSVYGLAIVNFADHAIRIKGGQAHRIHSCHLGVSRLGNVAEPCPGGGIYLDSTRNCTIGSASSARRNVILGGQDGHTGGAPSGIRLLRCQGITVIGNYIGLRRDGLAALDDSSISTHGVYCLEGGGNRIGGRLPGERNVIGGLGSGVKLNGETGDTIQGNLFGLGSDGNTSIPVEMRCLDAFGGTTDTLIGGATWAARNIFAGQLTGTGGVVFSDLGTEGNRVQGNLFGSNAEGTEFRPLDYGVVMESATGANTVGGSTAACGNYIAAANTGVMLQDNLGSVVRYNHIGMRRDGTAQSSWHGIYADHGRAHYVRDNVIVRSEEGLYVYSGGEVRAYNNTFRFCQTAVLIAGGTNPGVCLLGNLGNTSTTDDGGNVFRSSNTWFIRNASANAVRAEGNSFDTTVAAEIDAKIHDRLDDPALGRVDCRPLAGGVSPSAADGSGTDPPSSVPQSEE